MSLKYSITELPQNEINRWNSLLFDSVNPFYSGGKRYTEIQTLNKRNITTFILSERGKDIVGAHYTMKKTHNGLFKIADIHTGIYYKESNFPEWLPYFLKHFLHWAKMNNASYCRINPFIPKTISGKLLPNIDSFDKIIKDAGLQPILSGRYTYWINLNLSEEELKLKMKPQTRRKIKQAEKSALYLETTEVYDEEKVNAFYNYYNLLGKNKKFSTLSKGRFSAEIKALFDNGATLFYLVFNGEIVNIALTTTFGIASYYHGALNMDYKKLNGCPSPGHFMQWSIIKYLKKKGLSIYDMAYCPGPVPIKGHPQFNMWNFKHSFGGEPIELLPTYGMILKPIRGYIFQYLRYRKKI